MRIRAILGLVSIILLSYGASAQTFQTNGSWNTSTNWNPASVPSGTGTDVTLGANPTISASNTIGNVSVNNGVTIVINAAGGVLTLGSSALFNATPTQFKKSMTFNNNGTIQINGGTPDGLLEIWGDLIVNNNLTLQVTGNFIVHGNITMNNNATVQVTGGGTVTVGGDLTGGSNTTIQVAGGGSNLSVSGAISVGGGSSSISVSGGGSISAGSCACTGCPAANGCSSDVTLPVTLLFFNQEVSGNSVKFNWSTASELNFDFFEVERGANGKDFVSIAKIAGHGTSNVRNDYSLVDEKPLIGKNYYRLKSVDFDGYTEYFKVVAVDFSTDKRFFVSPNPSDGNSLDINLNFVPDGSSTVLVYDNLSNVIGVYSPTDYNQNIIFASSLKSGVYYAKIISGEFVKVERFVVR